MISPISFAVVDVNTKSSVNSTKKNHTSSNIIQLITPEEGLKVSGSQVLAQMPNVKFGSYGIEDLSAYENSSDPYPSEVEQRKYRLSVSAANDIEQGNYLMALKKKIHIADICRAQGKMDDADKLMEGARRLLRELPKYQIIEAVNLISNY